MQSVCSLCPREPRQEEMAFKEGRVIVTVSQGWDTCGRCQGGWGKARSSVPSDFKSLGVCPPTTTLWHPSSKALPSGVRALFLWQSPKPSNEKKVPVVQHIKEMLSFYVTKPSQTEG